MKVIEICRTLAKLPPDTEVYFLADDIDMLQEIEIRSFQQDLDDGTYEEEDVLQFIADGVIDSVDTVYIQAIG